MTVKNFPRGYFGDNKRYHQKLYLIDTFEEAGAETRCSYVYKNMSVLRVHS